MPTVTRTWVFLSDSEGLADVGDNASFTPVWTPDEGSPAAGSVEFAGSAANPSERMRRPSTGESWETWGVPAGATVTGVQVTAYQFNHWGLASAYRHRMRVVGSDGTLVHSAGDLVDASPAVSPTGTWRAGGAGTAQPVDSSSRPSSTDVRLELQASATATSNVADISFDTIELTITYEASPERTIVYTAKRMRPQGR